jgi:hypothetical protein
MRLGEYALVKGRTYGDFDMTLKAKSNENLATNSMADYAVVFGHVDANNYSFLMVNSDAAYTGLYQVVNGVRQEVAVAVRPGITDNAYHSVRVARTGLSVSVWLDGQQLLSSTDPRLAAPGAVGVGAYNESAYFDDVNVTAAQQPPPVQSPTAFGPDATSGDFANYAPLSGSRWSLVDDGGNKRLFLNTTAYKELSGMRLGEYALVKGRTYGDFDMTLKAKSSEDLAANPMADYAVVFSYVDANNYSFLMVNSDVAYTGLYQVVNGVRQEVAVATRPGIVDNALHDVRVKRTGSTVTAWVDGQQLLSATDTRLAVAGQLGVGAYNESAYFDDISVI